jgi:crotonobetainyl-CoA hydratase
VNGAAVGGGLEIVLACDVVLMADHAFFALPEMQRGILADAGAIQRLPRRIPYNVAVEFMLTGRRMAANEAARWGLAHQVVPGGELMATARTLAECELRQIAGLRRRHRGHAGLCGKARA